MGRKISCLTTTIDRKERISTNHNIYIFTLHRKLSSVISYYCTPMCLAIPGKVLELTTENGLKMGIIDVNGSKTRACLEYVPEIQIGQYTIVHAGFALKIIDEEEAAESLKLWQDLIDAGAFQPDEESPAPDFL